MSSLRQRLKPYYIAKALRYLRHYGVHDFAVRVRERLSREEVPYGPWREKHLPGEEELRRQKETVWENRENRANRANPVVFSVLVPLYRTPEYAFRAMADSVLAQTCPHLELVLANGSPDDAALQALLAEYRRRDARVKVVDLPDNEGITGNTNAAARAASGDFLCFLDHDDFLEPDALFEAARAIEEHPQARLLYTDEDKVRDDGKGGLEYFQPHLKPDFNLDLLRSNNYICHFLIADRRLCFEAGLLRRDFEGAQDYDFILRCVDVIAAGAKDSMADSSGTENTAAESTEADDSAAEDAAAKKSGMPCDADGVGASARSIVHIPKILYHWRVHSASTADNPASKQYAYEAGRRALEEHLARRGCAGTAQCLPDFGFYRVRYPVPEEQPLVSVVIPNREQKDVLERCITSLREKTAYKNYEIIVVENNSSSGEILNYYRHLRKSGQATVIRRRGAFNFSAVCNYGARHARGDYLVFMNNDIEIRSGEWLSELLGVCARPEVGACGPKLFYPDGKIQSAGIAVGIGGVAGSLFTGMDGAFSGYFHKASLLQDLSAVTAALVMVRRDQFEAVGGFTEELPLAFNDVDLCLKLRSRGALVVYDPFAEAVHHESLTRGDEYTAAKAALFKDAAAYMHQTWPAYYSEGDPYYNPNLSLTKWNYTLKE